MSGVFVYKKLFFVFFFLFFADIIENISENSVFSGPGNVAGFNSFTGNNYGEHCIKKNFGSIANFANHVLMASDVMFCKDFGIIGAESFGSKSITDEVEHGFAVFRNNVILVGVGMMDGFANGARVFKKVIRIKHNVAVLKRIGRNAEVFVPFFEHAQKMERRPQRFIF